MTGFNHKELLEAIGILEKTFVIARCVPFYKNKRLESVSRSFRSFLDKYSPSRGFITSNQLYDKVRINNIPITIVPHWYLYFKKSAWHRPAFNSFFPVFQVCQIIIWFDLKSCAGFACQGFFPFSSNHGITLSPRHRLPRTPALATGLELKVSGCLILCPATTPKKDNSL